MYVALLKKNDKEKVITMLKIVFFLKNNCNVFV